ncbi:hypothetical protein [Actinotalea fermentans]|uniref:Uncharacterized protein n=1 Tax=Actinotalea fermentans TaxID=43671 RepID=A0A511YWP5_9CELL|nr:hypothetical protein [Actinotalea fermentans]KGM15853.1 hypothetical protein N867_05025 [Actinotalea fermentans ATCC 43279 = JCM 9966 = DSM 3133]GEN79634.1 hypothetical protein AFE02nite_13680 [Actinotalea fermentans]
MSSPVAPGRPASAWHVLGSVALGLVVGVVGTGVHRANDPWGLVLAYGTVLAAAVLTRAWGRARAMVAYTLALAAMVLAMGFVRPGGDVLITDEGIGYAWLAAPALVLVVAVLPARWFSDQPRVGRRDPEQPS